MTNSNIVVMLGALAQSRALEIRQMLTLRYDDYDEDAVLRIECVRADQDGEPITPPILRLTDEQTGDTITLTREQAWKLRDLIQRM